MNYFELHVGDYDAATAHLSMLEDAAYGRMMRVYYRTEKPLPADIKQVCRLVRAQSKPERDAVETVLGEFFELQADGWHQTRCDEELQAYREREPEREARKSNEEARLKRHRVERAALFKALNDAGHHAPWNTKIEALRELVAALQGGSTATPATPPATATETPAVTPPATAPATLATATHGNVPPPPTSHLPPPKDKALVGRGSRLPPDWALPKAWGEWALTKYPQWTAEKVRDEATKFRNHWVATAGKAGTKLDWYATWQNWCMSDLAHRDDRKPTAEVTDLQAMFRRGAA